MQLKDAEAKAVWDYFGRLSGIPRKSGSEAAVVDWIESLAKESGVEYQRDEAGNIVLRVGASEGCEDRDAVCLQAHVDMVCEKTPDSEHDFGCDPIANIEKDGWVCADNTTLGADNGIGVAMMLAVAFDGSIKHPRLELLFTVDEETGLTGANGLGEGMLSAKTMINLDSDDNCFIVGCAGGQEIRIRVGVELEDLSEGDVVYDLKIAGLTGGHSGADIHKQRASANKLLGGVLGELGESVDIRIADIGGGSARNAIARDGFAVVAFARDKAELAEKIVAEQAKHAVADYKCVDPDIKITFAKRSESVDQVFSVNDTGRVIDCLCAVVHGAIRFCNDIEGVVETSNNLAVVSFDESERVVELHSFQRSCVMNQLDLVTDSIAAVGRLAGAEVVIDGRYPGWTPDFDSKLLGKCKDVFEGLFENEPDVRVIHAGLECGIIGEQHAGMDMIAIGPVIEYAHSPQEKVEIQSVDDCWRFLLKVLEEI